MKPIEPLTATIPPVSSATPVSMTHRVRRDVDAERGRGGVAEREGVEGPAGAASAVPTHDERRAGDRARSSRSRRRASP